MLLTLLEQNPPLLEVIHTIPALNLPHCFVAGASIAQTLWNIRHGFSPEAHIKDIDLVYFDPQDLSEESETRHQKRIQEHFAHLPMPVDVKNEARVHLWYKNTFGYDINPYTSVEEAIATFPITAGCIGIRKEENGYLIYTAFGYNDLFDCVVRPNKKQITQEIYEAKLRRWRPLWPNLTYVQW
jgi:uncharacterized protein